MQEEVQYFLKNYLGNDLQLKVSKLSGDASSREYFRINADGNSYLLCQDGTDDFQASSDFVRVQDILREQGIKVPDVYSHDQSRGLLLQQDLGEKTLISEIVGSKDPSPFYEKAIDLMTQFQKIENSNITKLSFDEVKLNSEVEVSIEFFMGKLLSCSDISKKKIESIYRDINQRLISKKMVLCHRDFHSKNIMVKSNDLYIIDFQDARWGLPQYDLVSLLDDSYILIKEDSRENLRRYYWKKMKDSLDFKDYDEFLLYYKLSALQRILKAIGSFSYLFFEKEKLNYLHYIGGSFEKLRNYFLDFPEYQDEFDLLVKSYYEY